jgi:hypothetical protein
MTEQEFEVLKQAFIRGSIERTEDNSDCISNLFDDGYLRVVRMGWYGPSDNGMQELRYRIIGKRDDAYVRDLVVRDGTIVIMERSGEGPAKSHEELFGQAAPEGWRDGRWGVADLIGGEDAQTVIVPQKVEVYSPTCDNCGKVLNVCLPFKRLRDGREVCMECAEEIDNER